MLCHAIYVRKTLLLATSVSIYGSFYMDCKICVPYFSGDHIMSISCLKYMEVVNTNVLFCYLVAIFLIKFFLTLFRYNLQFLIKSDHVFWMQRFKWFSASFMMKCLCYNFTYISWSWLIYYLRFQYCQPSCFVS